MCSQLRTHMCYWNLELLVSSMRSLFLKLLYLLGLPGMSRS
ncbi:Sjogren's syndrome nuclear autoantigen 1 (predicted), isoform CRA_c [Rattus norvegicus]|uniref:Sjogren's syndrome nuclear autoantigen 1 (Predicted), isoform CRA_c n=1 Tax=Rattus norvegicus TaxID=10116 RepID=A6JT26_RAT|nr:Sjogren's syndrome nuclear autoantigen 1 (predicted), isoform CRA_c [Rattus norvegicus]